MDKKLKNMKTKIYIFALFLLAGINVMQAQMADNAVWICFR